MASFIPTSSDFYGDDIRWFLGVVVNVNDPLKLGRVQVRIFGVHGDSLTDIPNGDLPWAQVVVPITEGGSSGIGTNIGIKNQAQVFGVFMDGSHSQSPLVLGSIPRFEGPLPQLGSFREETTVETDAIRIASIPKVGSDVKTKNPNAYTKVQKLTGSSNIEKSFNFFTSQMGGGYTAEQACGIIGNLIQESKIAGNVSSSAVKDKKGNVVDISPIAENPTNSAYGIAQWNPANPSENRFRNLVNYAKQHQLSYESLWAQLNFIKYELATYSYFGDGQLRQCDTVKEAAQVFDKLYERSGGEELESRIYFAENAFDNMKLED